MARPGQLQQQNSAVFFAATLVLWGVSVAFEVAVNGRRELLAVVGGFCFYQAANWVVRRSISRDPLFVNTSVSLLHSTITSTSIVLILVNQWSSKGLKSMFQHDQLFGGTWLGAYSALCFSCGYFAYDQLDMLRYRLYSGWIPSILVHHLVLLVCFTLALYRHVTINYLILSLVCEVMGDLQSQSQFPSLNTLNTPDVLSRNFLGDVGSILMGLLILLVIVGWGSLSRNIQLYLTVSVASPVVIHRKESRSMEYIDQGVLVITWGLLDCLNWILDSWCIVFTLCSHFSRILMNIFLQLHSIFLHVRKVRRMAGFRDAISVAVRAEWMLNWFTFLAARLVCHILITYKLIRDADKFGKGIELPLALFGMAGMNLLNIFLGFDLVRAYRRERNQVKTND